MSKITDFLKGTGTDHRGRAVKDYSVFSPKDLERGHDFIQWMFPSDIPSQCFEGAPVLTPEDIQELKTNEDIQTNLFDFLNMMLNFYTKSDHWLTHRNHNYLRITRILRCLHLANMKTDAKNFLDYLKNIYEEWEDVIGEETMSYWLNADNDILKEQ